MSQIYLGLDTETSGWKKNGALVQEGQGRVVQLGMILFNEDGDNIAEFCTLIKPEGWQISEGAFETHGISSDRCERFGLNQRSVMMMYQRLASMADYIVAHNSGFDKGMMEIEQGYYNQMLPNGMNREGEPLIISKPWQCTQVLSTPHCKLPPTEKMVKAGRTHFKSPNLEEALDILCNKKNFKAHDAMEDVRACKDIFLQCRKLAA